MMRLTPLRYILREVRDSASNVNEQVSQTRAAVLASSFVFPAQRLGFSTSDYPAYSLS